ncbi:MAG TPA: HAD family hydrolase [Mycobacteriales bacterium]|jgi:HAD superfamily hydrolase (TIGR01509 family)
MTETYGVLFDVDGTLVDTSYLHTVAWWEALRENDHVVPMRHIHRSIGMGSDHILDALLGEDRDTGDDDTIRAAHTALYAVYTDRLQPLPGARELLRECAKRGLKVVLASSASEREFRSLRAALDCDDVVDAATDASDADATKPAPDLLRAALDKSGLTPDRVVYVGDSVWDVESSTQLGIPCIGLTCGGLAASELHDAGAVETYADPADLLGSLDSSAVGDLLRSRPIMPGA